MCNLYRMTKNVAEVANWFNVANDTGQANLPDEIYPGYPGAVIADGHVRSMIWGFPLVLNRKNKKTGAPLKPKPVNNARSDKLDSFMWRYSFEERRCLIPLSAWAEAEGAKGSKTRTWLALPDTELFAVAGIWRESDEWGLCYSMVMTDSAGDARSVHSRMPVILTQSDYDTWENGDPRHALSLCQSNETSLQIDRTEQPWFRR